MITVETLDPVAFHGDVLPGLLERPEAAAAIRQLAGGRPMAWQIGDRAFTYRPVDGRLSVEPGLADDVGLVAELSPEAFAAFVAEVRTAAGLMFSGDLTFERGGYGDLIRWEPALRAIFSGRLVYEPTEVDGPLDASYLLPDADGISDHLRRCGFAHVRSVFSPDEVAALRAEVDRLSGAARPGDDKSWWAKTGDGEQVLCRLVYANEGSELIADLHHDNRIRDLVALSGHELESRPDRMEGHSVVIKIPGVVEGLADLPWHQDCGLGGHPWLCPSVAVGIQLEAATTETGQMHFLAGSHGATCRPFSDADLVDLPHVAVTTEAGDVTVHVADVMHAAPPPTGDTGRRTLYVTFHNPALFEHVGPGEAYNDIVRRQRPDGQVDPTVLGVGGTAPSVGQG